MNLHLAPIVGVWSLAVIAGVVAMAIHEATPGTAAKPPSQAAAFPPDPNSENLLLVFLHPQCPCSHATITELGKLISTMPNAPKPRIYFYKPMDQPMSWVHGDLWNAALEIPGAHLFIDSDGQTAAKYGAHTSGQVLLYNLQTKRLEFSGGITSGRAIEGDSGGGEALKSWLKGQPAARSGPVFGCSIR